MERSRCKLRETKLSLNVRLQTLEKLHRLGEFGKCRPNQILFQKNEPAKYLYVILDGDVILDYGNGDDRSLWIGAGDFVGEIGFILGRHRLATARSGPDGCTVWRLHRKQLFQHRNQTQSVLLALLLVSLSPHIQSRMAILHDPEPDPVDLLENHCDTGHPSVQQMASMLDTGDPWDTAIMIWRFIQTMPYRFGYWDMKASDVLRMGYGMCTTKANLHVALLRAVGIESGFAELKVPSDFVATLLPRGYRNRVGTYIKHYFAVAKLNGKWYPCDASFSKESLGVMAREIPEVADCLNRTMKRGEPFNMVGEYIGLSPFDFKLLPDLQPILFKKPFYGKHNLDAMNILLDQAQGPIFNYPAWVKVVRKILRTHPAAAFQKAYAGIFSDVYRLYVALQKSLQPTPVTPPDFAKQEVEKE
ncbi:MAG: cyclic nucleotide-binding domain-containing protein [candidate division KSB1 bacterium]|nr:cyclic nucleotide-binding domain-containing protein [candidate division KSB1 bacterium]MDQ7065160.1 cyclic nucleotide-binding domain-containing protein [candidate division KSB1 bacterium]